MRFFNAILLLPLVTAVTIPDAMDIENRDALPDSVVGSRSEAQPDSVFAPQACTTNPPCACLINTPAGIYCAECKAPSGKPRITKGAIAGHAYQCNPQGGCCDYGPAPGRGCGKGNPTCGG